MQKRKWIQVKSKKPNLEPFKSFKDNYCDKNDGVEVWIWKGKRDFEVIIV